MDFGLVEEFGVIAVGLTWSFKSLILSFHLCLFLYIKIRYSFEYLEYLYSLLLSHAEKTVVTNNLMRKCEKSASDFYINEAVLKRILLETIRI